MPDLQIAPSVLAADFTRLGAQVADAEAAGASRIHLDVMDGRFVPNISMGPLVLEAVRSVTRLPIDVHLMIVEPDHLLPAFAEAGATSIAVHWETCPHLHRTLQAIHALGCETGVAVNPHTPVELLADVLPLMDMALIMTVNPGFGGQSFLTGSLGRIQRLRMLTRIPIVVDGGISEVTAPQAAEAGATILVAGTSVFNRRETVASAMQRLRASLEAAPAQANEKPGFPGSSVS